MAKALFTDDINVNIESTIASLNKEIPISYTLKMEFGWQYNTCGADHLHRDYYFDIPYFEKVSKITFLTNVDNEGYTNFNDRRLITSDSYDYYVEGTITNAKATNNHVVIDATNTPCSGNTTIATNGFAGMVQIWIYYP